MKSKLAIAAFAAALATPMVVSTPAQAQYYSAPGYYDGYGRGGYEPAYYGGDHYYRGRDARHYQDCRRSSGTTGLIVGGAGGALLGRALGGGTLGTVLGAVGGGLLGKHLDEKHDAAQNYRNGC